MSKYSEIISAFSAEHMTKITGLTISQLAYWDKTGFFSPQYAAENRRSPYSRIYSFKDAVGLRTISVLKSKHGVSLSHLRKVAEYLAQYSEEPWATIKMWAWNRKVQFVEPETGKARGVLDGQYAMVAIMDVIEDVNLATEALKKRDVSKIGKTEKHRYVSHNDEVIAGTRIPVKTIVEFLKDGYSAKAILDEFPLLTEEDVNAVERKEMTANAA